MHRSSTRERSTHQSNPATCHLLQQKTTTPLSSSLIDSLQHQTPKIPTQMKLLNNKSPPRKSKPPDIELVTIQPNTYTSLRDIIAAGTSSPSNSPASPIFRNPLVQQAALAYLQPFGSPESTGNRSWPQRLKGCFVGEEDNQEEDDEIGCMGPLNGDVLTPIKEVFQRFVRGVWMVDRREEHRD